MTFFFVTQGYTNKNYDYGDCRFDMYAWVTDGWGFGGVGGDWGQRTSYDQWIGMRHMILHEVGHGLSLPDFYEEWKTPDLGSGIFGSTIKSIMIAGNSTVITDWDKWMLRYTWSQLKADTNRFPVIEVEPTTILTDSLTYDVTMALNSDYTPVTISPALTDIAQKLGISITDISNLANGTISLSYAAIQPNEQLHTNLILQ